MIMSSDFCDSCDKRCCFQASPCLTSAERNRILKATGKDLFKRVQGSYFPRLINGACAFFSEGRCTINEIKPMDCRIFPVVRGRDGMFIDAYCPEHGEIPAGDMAEMVAMASCTVPREAPSKGIPLREYLGMRGEDFRKRFFRELEKHNIPEDILLLFR